MSKTAVLKFFGETIYPKTLASNLLTENENPAPVLPNPSGIEDAGKIPTVNSEGNEYILQQSSSGGGGGDGCNYNIGSGLKFDQSTNTVSVDTATEIEQDNTRPVTSAAVYETLGNIEILLETI